MRKWFMILLCLVLLLSGCSGVPEASTAPSTQPPAEETTLPPASETTQPPATETTQPEEPEDPEKYESNRAPYPYMLLLHREDSDYLWLGEDAQAQMENAEVGGLYLWNKSTKKITRFTEDIVTCYGKSSLSLFYGTEDGRVVMTNFKGEDPTVIYQAKYGKIHSMNYETASRCLYFMDGSCVIMINKYDKIPFEVAFCKQEEVQSLTALETKSHGVIISIKFAWDDRIVIFPETGEVRQVDDLEMDRLLYG